MNRPEEKSPREYAAEMVAARGTRFASAREMRGVMSPRIDLRPDRLRWNPGLLDVAVLALLFCGSNLWAQKPEPIQNWPANGDYDDSGGNPSNQSTADGPAQDDQQPLYTEQPGDVPQNDQQQAYADPNQTYLQPGSQPAQALNPEQLEQIVAPIALYPDNLLAQVLAASTYPAQVVAADQWRRMLGNAPEQQIVAGADAQTSWDPSVKALTAFPQVLAEMARNLQWTTDLGNAYYNQPQDVMQTVQVLRDRAQAAGNLQSTPQQQVTVDQGNIEVAPPTPQIVYVPQYDPWSVYGQPVSPYPGFSLFGAVGSFWGPSPIQYGLGIALQAFAGAPWGWLGWGLDWSSHSVMFNHNSYCSRSTQVSDWGFAHGGPRAYRGGWERSGYRGGDGWGRGNYPRPRGGFDRGFDSRAGAFGNSGRFGKGRVAEGYQRGHQYSNDNFGRSAQQAYSRMPRAIGQPQQHGGRSQQFFGGRPQPYGGGSDAYGRQSNGRERQGYGSGQGIARANPIYRSPESGSRGTQAIRIARMEGTTEATGRREARVAASIGLGAAKTHRILVEAAAASAGRPILVAVILQRASEGLAEVTRLLRPATLVAAATSAVAVISVVEAIPGVVTQAVGATPGWRPL